MAITLLAFYRVRAGKHSSTKTEAVFCTWSVRRLYNDSPYRRDFNVQIVFKCLIVFERLSV
jgi:hypothetical protein